MQDFCNAQTFANNYHNNEKISKNLCRLILFTLHSKIDRNINSKLSLFNNITKNPNGELEYTFNYKGKNYPFSVFSDYKLQKIDKKVLESSKRIEEQLFRSLKLACSMDLVNPRIAIGNSLIGPFHILIIFQDKGIDRVIDYTTNLVMNKNDYYELFNYCELNTVDKFDLYNIYCMIDEFNDYEHIYEYLIFTKEIFNELSKKEPFEFLTKKYDINGFNNHNNILLGDNGDSLFFRDEDVYNMKYDKIIWELDSFTENPTEKSKYILYDNKKEKYKIKRKFGFFTFDLLSNMICDKEVKEQLLSKDRYNKCHQNAIMIARLLSEEDKKTTYIVGGKFKVNEIDYLLHSWIEIDEKNVVIDFNHNIVMNRDEYYKLYKVQPISKTIISEMEDIIETVIYDAKLYVHPIVLNYFGRELMSDLKKNKKILQKR